VHLYASLACRTRAASLGKHAGHPVVRRPARRGRGGLAKEEVSGPTLELQCFIAEHIGCPELWWDTRSTERKFNIWAFHDFVVRPLRRLASAPFIPLALRQLAPFRSRLSRSTPGKDGAISSPSNSSITIFSLYSDTRPDFGPRGASCQIWHIIGAGDSVGSEGL
jgi:hypothetical protein